MNQVKSALDALVLQVSNALYACKLWAKGGVTMAEKQKDKNRMENRRENNKKVDRNEKREDRLENKRDR